MMGRLQFWLQGHAAAMRGEPVHGGRARMWLGNAISDVRYWAWRVFSRGRERE